MPIKNMTNAGLLLLCLACPAWAMQQPMQPRDAYQNIRYEKAFRQDDLFKEYQSLMERMGCLDNVLPGRNPIADDEKEHSDNSYIALENGADNFADELGRFQAACLAKLNRARVMALSEPGIYSASEIILIGGSTGGAILALGINSMGGSFAGLIAFLDAFRQLRGVIQSGYYLMSRPDNQLDHVEQCFAKNKCFIPRALWPKIMHAFVSARQNEFARETHMSFIEFALGFTLHKPKPPLVFKDDLSLDDIKSEIFRRIDVFFVDYDTKDFDLSLKKLKINVGKFLDSLPATLGSRARPPMPRYLYLHGPAGIGKTHFVMTLSSWIQELIPRSILSEDIIVTTAGELQGSAQCAGAFLNILRRQAEQNKRSSVVMIDEATWLNETSMISPAKRIFNGDLSKLPTEYLGKAMDGSAIELAIPPMLIFVASNEEIGDAALKSRFDVLEYPKPTDAALIKHAEDVMRRSTYLKGWRDDRDKITAWVRGLSEEDRNFRHIAANIEAELGDQ